MDVRDIEIRLHNPGQWQCTAKTLDGQTEYLQKAGDWRPTAVYFDSEEQIRTLLAKLQPSSAVNHVSQPEPDSDDDDSSLNLGGLLGGLLGGGDGGGFSGGGGDFGGGGAGGDW